MCGDACAAAAQDGPAQGVLSDATGGGPGLTRNTVSSVDFVRPARTLSPGRRSGVEPREEVGRQPVHRWPQALVSERTDTIRLTNQSSLSTGVLGALIRLSSAAYSPSDRDPDNHRPHPPPTRSSRIPAAETGGAAVVAGDYPQYTSHGIAERSHVFPTLPMARGLFWRKIDGT